MGVDVLEDGVCFWNFFQAVKNPLMAVEYENDQK
jgi:hypothetical protein